MVRPASLPNAAAAAAMVQELPSAVPKRWAIRLTVAGQLTVDGLVSAKGGDGLQDNAGGGSGGSIWLSARKLAGAGQIAANGGGGELYNGGEAAAGASRCIRSRMRLPVKSR